MNFKEFLLEAETIPYPEVPPGVDPEMWENPTYRRAWLIQNPDYMKQARQQQQQQMDPAQAALERKVESRMNEIEQSLRLGSIAPDWLVRILGLNTGAGRSWVADSLLNAKQAYPFWRSRRDPTKVMFNQHYPLASFRREFLDSIKQAVQRRIA